MTNSRLQSSQWADYTKDRVLKINSHERSITMCHSDGTGEPLLSHNNFGADIIRFPAGKGVNTHIHDGDHILFVLSGSGILEFGPEEHELYPGLCYLVPGNIEHAIKAKEDLVLIAVGNDHRPLDSNTRLTPIKT